MITTRRRFIAGTSAAAVAFTMAQRAFAQAFPSRPIEIVVGQPAGGGIDLYARAVALGLAPELNGQAAVVVNRPGAAGVIATEEVMGATPDGHKINGVSAGTAIIKRIWDGNGPDITKDLRPVATIGRYYSCFVVRKDAPYKDAKEWMEFVRASGRPVRWAHTGKGGIHHIAGQALLSAHKLQARDVPFDGSPAARNALINGEVDFVVFGTQNITGFENEVRTVGVIAAEREPLLPDGLTMREQGVGSPLFFTPLTLLVPAQTPDDRVAFLEAAVRKAVDSEAFKTAAKNGGFAGAFLNAQETAAWGTKAVSEWTPIIEQIKSSTK